VRRAWIRVAIAALPLLAIAGVWLAADLRQYHSAQAVAEEVRAVADRPFGFAVVPLVFAAGTLFFVPVNALIVGASLAFEPLRAFALSLAGALLGAAATYALGLLLGGKVVDLFSGPRLQRFVGSLRSHAFRSSLILHILPFGSFTAVNLFAGAVRVPFPGFLAGTAVGLLPGVAFLTLLAGQLPEVFREPSPVNVALMLLGAAGLVAAIVLLGRWARSREGAA